MACPGSTAAGCRCAEHHPGLSEHARDLDAYLQALAPLRAPLRVIAPAGHHCDGTMTCVCARCSTERQRRRPAPTRQPWDPRPARHAA